MAETTTTKTVEQALLESLLNNGTAVYTNDNFGLPEFDDFYQNDIPYHVQQALKANNNQTFSELYYIEKPYAIDSGYYEDVDVFMFRANPITFGWGNDSYSINDGDTVYFDLESLDKYNQDAVLYLLDRENNTKELVSLNDYIVDSIRPKETNGRFGLRFVGVQAPEVEHGNMIYDNDYSDGNKAQKLLHDLLFKADGTANYSDLVIVADNKALNRAYNEYPLLYSTDMLYDSSFGFDGLVNLIKYFRGEENAVPAYSNFALPGRDSYNRLLGCIYIKTNISTTINGVIYDLGEHWINVTKYMLYHLGEEGIDPSGYELYLNPESPTARSHANYFSSAFKLNTYDVKQYKTIDLLDNASVENIAKQRELQRNIVGYDFDSELRDWTVMIGDCLFVVPPTSIRCITQHNTEMVPMLRSKGSAIKQAPQAERMIELTLYFNDENSINGYPVYCNMPNNKNYYFDDNGNQTEERIVYYMNGLRSLISMFKLTPFLPINNTYINEQLGVEAVALANLNISTVPNYPKLISATLQLLEFNYSVYMTETPYTGDEDADTLITSNMFEKCIDYETLRYYYQKPIHRGQVVSNYEYSSDEYLNLTYGSRTALQPMTFGDSRIEFYLPDKDWLDKLLQIKLEAIANPIKTTYKITDDAKEYAKEIGKLFPLFGKITDHNDDIISKILNPNNIDLKPKDYGNSYYLDEDDFPYYDNDALHHLIAYKDKALGYVCKLKYGVPSNVVSHLDYYINSSFNISPKNKTEYANTAIYVPYTLSIANSKILTAENRKNFLVNISSSAGFTNNYSEVFADNAMTTIYLPFDITNLGENNRITENSKIVANEDSDEYKFIRYCYYTYTLDNVVGDITDEMQTEVNTLKQDIDLDSVNSFKFIKYPDDILFNDLVVTDVAASFGNNLSKIYLKSLDGYAPQYLGGTDTIIEVSLTTQNEQALALLNALPKICAQYIREYRLVLSCCPLRINTAFTRFAGVNEVLIDSCDIATVPNQPGLYNVVIRMIAMDRSLRNKEALKKLDGINNAGSQSINAKQTYAIRNYFDIENKIAAAEIYPDLELPTINELNLYGFNYIKYQLSDSARVYPDPDFYFIYGASTMNKLLRDAVMKTLDEQFSDSTARQSTYEVEDRTNGVVSFSINSDTNNDNVIDNVVYNNIAKKQELNNYDELIVKYLTPSTKQAQTDDLSNTVYDQLTANQHSKILSLYSKYGYTNCWDVASNIKCVFTESIYKNNKYDSQEFTTYRRNYQSIISKNITILQNETLDNIKENIFEIVSDNPYKASQNTKMNQLLLGDIKKDNYISSLVDGFYNVYNMNFDHSDDYGISLPDKNILKAIAATFSATIEYSESKDKGWKGRMLHEEGTPYYQTFDGNPIISLDNDPLVYTETNNIKRFGPFGIPLYSGEEILKLNPSESYIHPSKMYFANSEIRKYQKVIYGDYDGSISYSKAIQVVNNYKLSLLYDGYISLCEALLNLCYVEKYLIQQRILLSLSSYLLTNYDSIHHQLKTDANFDDKIKVVYVPDENVGSYYTEATFPGDWSFIQNTPGQQTNVYVNHNGVSNTYTVTVLYLSEVDYQNLCESEKILRNAFESGLISKDYFSELSRQLWDSYGKAASNINNYAENITDTIKDESEAFQAGHAFSVASVYIDGIDGHLQTMFDAEDYSSLNNMVRNFSVSQGVTYENRAFYRFLCALVGYGAIEAFTDLGAESQSSTEQAQSFYDELIKINRINDPYINTRDSYYDMITTDMRGRMARAFPTFYLMFIDEGREIGLWKLNDNFYNMSSITDISITKSRKIAADTCNITMTNMFKTYTTDDEDGKEMAYDLETLQSMESGLAEVWNSIMHPRSQFLKEQLEREEYNPIERTQLQPGARMHVRLGYGSDASLLPTVFNGVVAEVTAGELINIVCQGDGVELMNPILETQDAEDVKHQNYFPIAKQISNWIKKGATPREILVSMLNLKSGSWLKSQIANFTAGRFYNSNPYGIHHFGDPDYKDVFANSECGQNIYEALAKPTFNDGTYKYITQLQDDYNMDEVPKLSAHLFGKTYWDIMHICAGASNDFVASIVPFGLRSSIFYGLPNYYCAYKYFKHYDSSNDSSDRIERIKEKRKPFQQYHIYTSYSDIIQTNIAASSKDIKTCAVGLYSANGIFGSEHTKQLERMWVDVDIYPEYQKTMTVDTGFVANGVPVIGDIIPYLNSILNEIGATNVKETAWRMTAKALKDSMKDMYKGELMVIGDPSVKPYDIFNMEDAYEDIQGTCEVEAVVHHFNAQSGFTTSIYPDLLCDIDNRYTQMMYHIRSEVFSRSALSWGLAMGIQGIGWHWGKTLSGSLARMVAKGTYNTVSQVQRFTKFLDLDEPITKTMLKGIDDAQDWFFSNDITYYKNAASGLFEDISKISKIENLDDLFKVYNKLIDSRQAYNKFDELAKGHIESRAFEKNIDNYQDIVNAINDSYDDILSKVDLPDLSKVNTDALNGIINSSSDEISKTLKDAATTISKYAGQKIDDLDKLDEVMRAYKTLNASGFVKEGATEGIEGLFNTAIKSLDDAFDASRIATKVDDVAGAAKTIVSNFDETAQLLRGARYAAIFTPAGLIYTVASIAIEYLVTAILTGLASNYITRFMRNLEVLRVYPLFKNGKVYTAGLSGSRGIVVGSATYDMQGWLQSVLIDMTESGFGSGKTTLLGGLWDIVGGGFLDLSDAEAIIQSYKRNNGIESSDTNSSFKNQQLNTQLSNIASYLIAGQDLMASFDQLERIKTLNGMNATDEEKEAASEMFGSLLLYDQDIDYEYLTNNLTDIRHLTDYTSNAYSTTDIVKSYHYNLDEITHDPLAIATQIMNLPESVSRSQIRVSTPHYYVTKDSSGVIIHNNYPFLCTELINILINIIDRIHNDYYHNNYCNNDNEPVQLWITSAACLANTNDLATNNFSWHNTGYGCEIYLTNSDNLETYLSELQTRYPTVFQYEFKQETSDGYKVYNLIVYPPLNYTAVTNSVLE